MPSGIQLFSFSSCGKGMFSGTGFFLGGVVVVVNINALAPDICHVLKSEV